MHLPSAAQPTDAKRHTVLTAMWFTDSFMLLAIDRFLKEMALGQTAAVEPAWFTFSLFKNYGIAFSLPLVEQLYWPLAAVIIGVLLMLFGRSLGLGNGGAERDGMRAGMLFCVILGALSNLYDRATYGFVVDYLTFFGRGSINIADAMIVVGLLGLYWKSVRPNRVTTTISETSARLS